MKNNIFLSRFLLLMLLATMVFQTKHSYAHLIEQLEVSVCHHENTSSDKQITHAHHFSEPCSVCSFTISHFINASLLYFEVLPIEASFKNHDIEVIIPRLLFPGSLFALRAPPVV